MIVMKSTAKNGPVKTIESMPGTISKKASTTPTMNVRKIIANATFPKVFGLLSNVSLSYISVVCLSIN